MSLCISVRICDSEVGVPISEETTTADVKQLVADSEGMNIDSFDLKLEGRFLQPDDVLVEKGIHEGQEIEAIPTKKAAAMLRLQNSKPTISNLISEASRGGDLVTFYVDAGVPYDAEQSQETALLAAAGSGHLHTVKELMKLYQEDPEIKTKINNTAESPLTRAAKSGRIDVLEYLLSEPALDINHKGISSLGSPLYAACENNYFNIARVLIKNGADSENRGPHNSTPLLAAAFAGNLAIVKLLVVHGSDINTQNNFQETPLLSAASEGHISVVQYLISEGADVNILNNISESPLFRSCIKGYSKVAVALIDAAADCSIITKYMETAMMVAASSGAANIVKMLANAEGTNLNVRNSRGETSLHYAALHGHVDVVKVLCELGINANAQSNRGDTALLASLSSGVECLEIVKELTKSSSCIEVADFSGHTPLIRASQLQLLSVVEHLLECKSNVSASSVARDTALWFAVNNSHHEITSLLVQHGALDHEVIGTEPIITRACTIGNSGIVELLLSHGADANHLNAKNQTPLMKATMRGHVEVVKLLLQSGARVSPTDNDGNTSLHLSCLLGHVPIARMLISHKASLQVVNSDVETPLLLAINSCKMELINLLLENSNESTNYAFPLHRASSLGIPSIVNAVMSAIPQSVNMPDGSGEPPLFYAVRSEDIQTIDMLVDEGGADINHRNDNGETALFCACLQRHFKIAMYLVKKGASPSIPTYKGKLPSDLVQPLSVAPLSAFYRDEDIFLSNTLLSKLKENDNEESKSSEKKKKRKVKGCDGCCVIS